MSVFAVVLWLTLGVGAEEQSILLYPGGETVLEPPEKVEVGPRRPRLGDHKKEWRVLRAMVTRQGKPAKQVVTRIANRHAIRIGAWPEAEVGVRVLAVTTETTRFAYQEVALPDATGRITKRVQWAELDRSETDREYSVVVGIQQLPLLRVPTGDHLGLVLPDEVRGIEIQKDRTPKAHVDIGRGTQLVIHGDKPGKARFKVDYRVGPRKLQVELHVEVISEPPRLQLELLENETQSLDLSRVEKDLRLRKGEVLRVRAAPAAALARLWRDDKGSRVEGLRPGETHATLVYEGWRRKGRAPEKLRTLLSVQILVKPRP